MDPATTLDTITARVGGVPVQDSHCRIKEVRFPAAQLPTAMAESANSSSADATPALEIAGSGGATTIVAKVTFPRPRTGNEFGGGATILHAPKEPSTRRRLAPFHESSALACKESASAAEARAAALVFPKRETDENRAHADGSAGDSSADPRARLSSPRRTAPSDDAVSALRPSPEMATATVTAYVMCADADGSEVGVELAKAVVVDVGDEPTVADGVGECDGERHCRMLLDDVNDAVGEASAEPEGDKNELADDVRDAVDVRVDETDFVCVTVTEKLPLPDSLPVALGNDEGERPLDAVGNRDARGDTEAILADTLADAYAEVDGDSDMKVADGCVLKDAGRKLELRDGRSVTAVEADVDALDDTDGVADREKEPELVADDERDSKERVPVGDAVLTRLPPADIEDDGVVDKDGVTDRVLSDAVALVDGEMLGLPDRDRDPLAVRDTVADDDGDREESADFEAAGDVSGFADTLAVPDGKRGDELVLRLTDRVKVLDAVWETEHVSEGDAEVERVLETDPEGDVVVRAVGDEERVAAGVPLNCE